jgi:hypothetical protein
MKLSELFVALSEESFKAQLRGISFGTLKTYQFYDRLRTRCHLAKLNKENLQLAAPRLFERLRNGEEDLALELSQSILISQLPLIEDVLNHFGIPHEDGFFAKETDPKDFLKEGWQQQAYDAFAEKYPKPLLVFYLNHLAHEMDENTPVFQPAA